MKKFLALSLCTALICSLTGCGDSGSKGMLSFEGSNLFKLTTAEEFAKGEMENVEPADVGDGAVQLSGDALEGTYISPQYSCAAFARMVACWNASIEDGASVEIYARAKREGAKKDVLWTDWLTWGEFSPYIQRGTTEGKTGMGAYVDEDTFISSGGMLNGFQMKAVLKRESTDIASPVLRQLTMTFRGGDMVPAYAEEKVELPAQAFCASPAYSQEIRWSSVADSICSPTTMSVILNTFDPELDLLPEEIALSSKDCGEHLFGSWSFTCAFGGCYGYSCYCQYGGKDVLLQEVAKGHPVGLSVSYSPRTLTGTWDETDGHLLTIIGYEYEDGIMDDDHLYFFSSDSYSAMDCESYRRYKWTEMEQMDSSFICYVVPSDVREVESTGVTRVEVGIAQGPEENTWILVDQDGNQLPLDNFRSNKGFVAYTIEGVGTDMTADTYESDWSIVYPNAINVSANNTFTYINPEKDSTFVLNIEEAYEAAGVKDGKITVYAIGDSGYMYIAQM